MKTSDVLSNVADDVPFERGDVDEHETGDWFVNADVDEISEQLDTATDDEDIPELGIDVAHEKIADLDISKAAADDDGITDLNTDDGEITAAEITAANDGITDLDISNAANDESGDDISALGGRRRRRGGRRRRKSPSRRSGGGRRRRKSPVRSIKRKVVRRANKLKKETIKVVNKGLALLPARCDVKASKFQDLLQRIQKELTQCRGQSLLGHDYGDNIIDAIETTQDDFDTIDDDLDDANDESGDDISALGGKRRRRRRRSRGGRRRRESPSRRSGGGRSCKNALQQIGNGKIFKDPKNLDGLACNAAWKILFGPQTDVIIKSMKALLQSLEKDCPAFSVGKKREKPAFTLGLVLDAAGSQGIATGGASAELGFGIDLFMNQFCYVGACTYTGYQFPDLPDAGVTTALALAGHKSIQSIPGTAYDVSVGAEGKIPGTGIGLDAGLSYMFAEKNKYDKMVGLGITASVSAATPSTPVGASFTWGQCHTPSGGCVTTKGVKCENVKIGAAQALLGMYFSIFDSPRQAKLVPIVSIVSTVLFVTAISLHRRRALFTMKLADEETPLLKASKRQQ